MKLQEMNKRQQKAYMNIVNAANYLIGGLENTTLDCPKDSSEYKEAVEALTNHEWLVKELYRMATTEIHMTGGMVFDKETTKRYLRDINFCGKDWLMERCERRITKLENEGICIG